MSAPSQVQITDDEIAVLLVALMDYKQRQIRESIRSNVSQAEKDLADRNWSIADDVLAKVRYA